MFVSTCWSFHVGQFYYSFLRFVFNMKYQHEVTNMK